MRIQRTILAAAAALLLAQLGNVDYVWWSFPIAEVMSAAATTFFFNRIYKNIISRIGIEEEVPGEA